MKKCFKCDTEKRKTEFYKNRRNRSELASECKQCQKTYSNNYYSKNKVSAKKAVRKNKEDYLLRNTRYILNHLKTHACIVCGENDLQVLEFDHIDPNQKIQTISIMKGYSSTETLQKEMDKCQVLCANCHRRKTAKQLNFLSWRILNGVIV